MNIPTEPDQCEKSHKEIKITLLANSGAPWKEWIIEHNWKKYRIGKDGSMTLAVNGWEIYANGHAVTKIVKSQVQQWISEIVLQHDSWKWIIKLQQL